MQLYLLRHAIAEARSVDKADALRALTAAGRARFAKVVAGWSRLGLRFDVLYTSPWRRAQETAALVEAAQLAPVPQVLDCLAAPPGLALLRYLQELSQASSEVRHIALVGHEPWLSDLLAWLMLGRREAPATLALKKGGLVGLRGPLRPGAMQLRACLPPKLALRLAATPSAS